MIDLSVFVSQLRFQGQGSRSTAVGQRMSWAIEQVELLQLVSKLHSSIQDLDKMTMKDCIVPYSEKVSIAEQMFFAARDGLECDSDLWSKVVFQLRNHKHKLQQHLEDCWHETIIWKQTGSTEVEIGRDKQHLKDLFSSLQSVGHLDELICELSTGILQDVILPAMKPDCRVERTNSGLLVCPGDQSVTNTKRLIPVFENMAIIFMFMNQHLQFQLPHSDVSVMKMVGDNMSEEFTRNFIDLCLKPALVAGSPADPDAQTLLERIHHFELQLMHVGILTKEDQPSAISEFIDNLSTHYAGDECLESLCRARKLMFADLNDTVQPEHANLNDHTMDGHEEAAALCRMMDEAAGVMTARGANVQWSPLAIVKCLISRSTQQLTELMESLIDEAITSPPDRSSRLLYTVRLICELHMSAVHRFHSEDIEKLPFQAAVAYNNSMYLGHMILILGTSHLIKIANQNAVPLMDLVVEFRQSAAGHFLQHINRQRNQLETNLRQECFTDAAIRQSLGQLCHLQRAWTDVLPADVYVKAMATICDGLLEQIIARIISMEEIAATTVLELIDQCRNVTCALPELFGKVSVVSSSVRSGQPDSLLPPTQWAKFQQLVSLLTCSGLNEIEQRWATGKGSLSGHFSADEVRHIVRAMFPESEQRMATLMKIK